MKNNLFYSSQYGFRKLHSTELAGLELIEWLSKYIDDKNVSLADRIYGLIESLRYPKPPDTTKEVELLWHNRRNASMVLKLS